ncbi:hypothetical protein RIF29_36339 [Crotalaria pallida]|uniref:Uncharacterized protein n=1 Tax=Crotalaria pallida TaxID=3830 RepID=A0AAN9EB03_CROPI
MEKYQLYDVYFDLQGFFQLTIYVINLTYLNYYYIVLFCFHNKPLGFPFLLELLHLLSSIKILSTYIFLFSFLISLRVCEVFY